MSFDLADRLDYKSLEKRAQGWIIANRIQTATDWLPFHFDYCDFFYGLQFSPVDLGWRQLGTTEDLFQLLFELSLVRWLELNGLEVNTQELFAIPDDFRSSELRLHYTYRCSDPLTRIVSFRPLQLSLQNYTSDELLLLIDWYGFELPQLQGYQVPTEVTESGMIVITGIAQQSPHIDPRAIFNKLDERIVTIAAAELPRAFLAYALTILNEAVPVFEVPVSNRLLQHADEAKWLLDWEPWLYVHRRRLALCLDTVAHYVGNTFMEINSTCRRQGGFSDLIAKLLQSFTLVPPLPAEVIVSRCLHGKFAMNLPLNEVQTEKGFFSTTLKRRKRGSVCLHLRVPKGKPVLAVLAITTSEMELLFPPSTRYVLTSRQVRSRVVYYQGYVL